MATTVASPPWGTGPLATRLPTQDGELAPVYVNVANAGSTPLTHADYVLSSPPDLPVALEACLGSWDELADTCGGAVVEVASTAERPEVRAVSGEVPHAAGTVLRLRLRPLQPAAEPVDAPVVLSVEVTTPSG